VSTGKEKAPGEPFVEPISDLEKVLGNSVRRCSDSANTARGFKKKVQKRGEILRSGSPGGQRSRREPGPKGPGEGFDIPLRQRGGGRMGG